MLGTNATSLQLAHPPSSVFHSKRQEGRCLADWPHAPGAPSKPLWSTVCAWLTASDSCRPFPNPCSRFFHPRRQRRNRPPGSLPSGTSDNGHCCCCCWAVCVPHVFPATTTTATATPPPPPPPHPATPTKTTAAAAEAAGTATSCHSHSHSHSHSNSLSDARRNPECQRRHISTFSFVLCRAFYRNPVDCVAPVVQTIPFPPLSSTFAQSVLQLLIMDGR